MKDADETAKRRTRMRSEERRASILESAKRVFAQHSYAEASTSLLAQESGITEPMLYRHFSSKKLLFLEVLREYSLRFFQQWQERVVEREKQDILDALTHVILDYRQIMASDPDIHRVLHQAVGEVSDPDFGVRVEAHNRKIAAVITELLIKAQQKGMLLEDVNIEVATWGYISIIYTMQYSYVLQIQDRLSSETLAKMSQNWLRGWLNQQYREKIG